MQKSVVDSSIFLSYSDPRIRNPDLRIRILEANYLHIRPDLDPTFLWAFEENMLSIGKVNH
jgi:hypothetical protein